MLRPDQELMDMRPALNLPDVGFNQAIEGFQNDVLRPVLKMQHKLILALLHDAPYFRKYVSTAKDREEYLRLSIKWLSENPLTKQRLIGSVIGLLTLDEYQRYLPNAKELDKRIAAMMAQRATDDCWGPRSA